MKIWNAVASSTKLAVNMKKRVLNCAVTASMPVNHHWMCSTTTRLRSPDSVWLKLMTMASGILKTAKWLARKSRSVPKSALLGWPRLILSM